MAERHTAPSGTRRVSVSGSEASLSEIFFWIRSEIFEYGLLPQSPHSDISFASLLAIVRKYRNTHELNAQYLKAINTLYSTNTSPENVCMRYSEWEIIASEDLLLCPAQARVYFERFCIVRDNLVGTQSSARKPLPTDKREVNFYEFIIYLYLQLANQPSFGHNFAKGIRWPTTVEASFAPTVRSHLPPLSARDQRDGNPLSARRGVRNVRKAGKPEPSPRGGAPKTEGAASTQPADGASGTPLASSTGSTTSSGGSPSPRGIEKPIASSTPRVGAKSPSRMIQSPRDKGAASSSSSGSGTPRSSKGGAPALSSENKRLSGQLIPPTVITHSTVPHPMSSKPSLVEPRDRFSKYSLTNVTLSEQLAFIQEHLGSILRLLCADDPSCNVRRSELEPLNFLLAVGQSSFAVHELNLIDVLPKAATVERYSRIDLTEWILLRLKVNAFLYSPNPADARMEGIQMPMTNFPTKNIVKRPISVIGVHQQTLLRADPESIPTRGSVDVAYVNDDSVDGRFARIVNSNSSFIYILSPVSCAKIQHCTESIVVVGAVGNLVIVENCKDTTILTACKSIQISNCENCVFYLQTSTQPLVLANNYGLQFGPYCTHYRSLDRHVAEAGLDTSKNLWNQPLLYIVELLKDHQPHVIPMGGSRHPLRTAISKLEKQTYSLVAPDSFSPFRVPFELHGPTKQIPFVLPSDYQLALEDHTEEAILLKKELDRLIQDKRQQAQVQSLVRAQFEKWLAETGAMQQIEDLVKLQIQ